MPAPSKIKGNSFEREISALLNTQFRTTEFSRSPGSGAYFGGKNSTKSGTSHSIETLTGDLITPLDFPYSVECKSYAPTNGPSFYNVALGKDRMLDKWLAQAESDAIKKEKQVLLFIKITRRGTWFVIKQNIPLCQSHIRYEYNGNYYAILPIDSLPILGREIDIQQVYK